MKRTLFKKNRRKELFEPLVPLVSKKVSVNFYSSYDNDTYWEIVLLNPEISLYKSQGQGRGVTSSVTGVGGNFVED